MDLASLSLDTFTELDERTFLLKVGDREVAIELAEATPGLPTLREGGAFNLIWKGPAEPILPQGMYALSHPGLGDLDMFMVPVGQEEGATLYESVFA